MKIKVNILEPAFVPTLGRGPFHDKLISEELYRSLKRLGYLIEEVQEPLAGKLVLDPGDQGSAPATSEETYQETSYEAPTEPAPEEQPQEGTPSEPAEEEPLALDEEEPQSEETSPAEPEAEQSPAAPEEAKSEDAPQEEAPEAAQPVDAAKLFTEEEITFLKGKARSGEIKDLLTSKGIEIPEDKTTIADMLALVGLER